MPVGASVQPRPLHLEVPSLSKFQHSCLFNPKKSSPKQNAQATLSSKATMLRRTPTAITLTTEDVAIYEDARAREAHQREQLALQAQALAQQQVTPQKNQNLREPNDELRPVPGDRPRAPQVKTRDERLGIGVGGSSSRG
jgi:hypothetical protein